MGRLTIPLLIIVPTLIIVAVLLIYGFTECFVPNEGANVSVVVNGTVVQVTDRTTDSSPSASRISITSFKKLTQREAVRCGRTRHPHDNREFAGRIVGGRRASIMDYPWMVSLQREKSLWFGFKGYHHSCGGTLISPSWIITASHCFYSGGQSKYRVVAGTDDMNYLYRAQIRTISKLIMHDDFDITIYNNDIALIKVNEPFILDSTFSSVSAICFERDIPIIPYDIAQICGFGASGYGQRSRTHLYATEIAIIDQVTCNDSFRTINDNMICAGGMIAHKRDACSGDSGGPLMMENGDHMSLVGAVSFGNDCALENFPGVYTRLNNYYDWVLDRIDEALISP